MPLKVTCKNLQRGPFQRLLYTTESNFEDYEHGDYDKRLIDNEERVIEHTIDDMAEVHLRFLQHLPVNFNPERKNSILVFVMITARKLESAKNLTIHLNTNCKALNYSEQLVCTDKLVQYINMGTIKCDSKGGKLFMVNDLEINLSVNKVETVNFAKLYDDTTLTDFQLSTAEGSVAVHKACLAAHSDVFKSMFNEDWKETTEGRIQLEGVTLATLQHLKDYVYLGTLPDEGLRPLLFLSSYYYMETLMTECIAKLVKSAEPENLYSLLEFACANNIPELTFAILLQTSDDIVHKTYQIKKGKEICKQTIEG